MSVDDPDQVRWHATRLRRLAGEVSEEDFAPEAPAVPPVKPTVVSIDEQEAARAGEADRHTQPWDISTTQELTSPTLIARSPEAPDAPEESTEPDESTEPPAESADAGEDAKGSLGDGDRPEQPA